jgi:hypothetical protein
VKVTSQFVIVHMPRSHAEALYEYRLEGVRVWVIYDCGISDRQWSWWPLLDSRYLSSGDCEIPLSWYNPIEKNRALLIYFLILIIKAFSTSVINTKLTSLQIAVDRAAICKTFSPFPPLRLISTYAWIKKKNVLSKEPFHSVRTTSKMFLAFVAYS